MSHLTYAEAVITGILQGVTELFPISSLGHNVLVPALIGGQWAKDLSVTANKSPYLAFVVALHVATAFAMIIYFRRDWIRIVRGFFSSVRNRQVVDADERLAWMIILGTIPVGIVGLVLQKVVTSVFAQPAFTAIFLAVNGGILLFSERQRAQAQFAGGPDAGFDDFGGEPDFGPGRGGGLGPGRGGGLGGGRGGGLGGGRGGGLGRLRERGGRRRDFDDGADGGFWDDSAWDEERQPSRGGPPVDAPPDPRFRDDAPFRDDARFQDDPRRGGGDPGRAPGFQPAPGQPGPGFSPNPGQPGRGPARGGYDPSDEERTQVWNQQPGQQQWQGPDPRYNDPRYGQDPRYSQDPRRGRPGPRDPRNAQEPAPGQGPAFTPSFNPAGGPPGGPADGPAGGRAAGGNPPAPQYDQPAPGFSPHGGQDPRAPQDDVHTARYPQGAPAGPPAGPPPAGAPAGGGGPSFTPAGPSGPGAGPRGAGRPPWEGGPPGRRGYVPDPSEQTSVDVVDLPEQYDENDENVAADRRLATMSFKQAMLVGAWQIAALLPGISRDGIVTVGGMRTHLRRDDAVRFSFLLSAPVLLAAGLLKLPDLAGPEGNGIMGPVIVGSLLSFAGAYISVRFLTKYFSESRSLKPFGYYCLGFGILSLLLIIAGV